MDFPLMEEFSKAAHFKGAKAADLVGWTPVRVRRQGRDLRVTWLNMHGLPFHDPFFADTVNRFLGRKSGVRVAETGLKMLAEVKRLGPTLPPAGFIFHMSRCGSTLAANYLAALPGNRVLREPLLFGPIFEATDLGEAEQIRRLRGLVSALGQPLAGEKRFFIKFGPLGVLNLPLIIKAFPEVPWVFLYRNPVEVMTSNYNDSLNGWFWNENMNGVPRRRLAAMSWAEVCARAMARICRTAASAASPRGLMINYSRLDARTVLKHFGITPNAAETKRLARVSGHYAKAPVGSHRKFKADSRQKRRTAPAIVRRMAQVWLAEVYRKLERQSLRSISGNSAASARTSSR